VLVWRIILCGSVQGETLHKFKKQAGPGVPGQKTKTKYYGKNNYCCKIFFKFFF